MRRLDTWLQAYCHINYVSRCPAIIVVAALIAPAHAQSVSTDDAARRDAAIVAARDGEYAPALTTLTELRARYPDEHSLLHDQMTVLAWSENDQAAVELAALLAPETAPEYAQLAIAKSARNLGRFDLAGRWYEAALANDPGNADALTGRLMTAADAGDIAGVRRLIASIEAHGEATDAADNRSLRLAEAYALRVIGDSLLSLAAYDALLDAEPGDAEALRGKALVLRSMLLPTQALELAIANPGILTDEEVERLRADEAAIRLRLTARTTYPESDRYRSIDGALAAIDRQLETTKTEAGRLALSLDRVVALSDTHQAEAAIAAFEALPEAATIDQPYVLAAAARAYLEAERPEPALALLERALSLDPENPEIRFSLVYAWLDLDRFDEAYALTRELTGSLPIANRSGEGARIVKGNQDRLRAELLAGIAEAYGDQLEDAQRRFENLLIRAPSNGDLRHELANVYRWRGWRDRSLDQYRQVLAANDEILSARLGYAHAQIDARDFRSVETAVNDMNAEFGREPAVQRLAERWTIHNRRELVITASTGDSTGPVSGSDNYTIDARWYTRPIAYRYRAFVASHDSFAEFPEGEARRRRIGAGVEYRTPRLTASARISASRSGGEAGFAAEADYRVSDFWTIGAGLEADSDAVQLRAHRIGIDADRAYASARYAPDELKSITMGLRRDDYSDSNTLQSSYAEGRYRLLNRPRSKLEATGQAALGSADTSNVAYFSPTRDRSLMLGLEHEYRIHRRYQRELSQHVSIGRGSYSQTGFGSDSIWRVSYRLDWTLSERHVLGVGVERLGQIFDGTREHTSVAFVALQSRF